MCDPRDNGSGRWGKSPSECTVPSPWKQIMSQAASNANLNEMFHPGECRIVYEPMPLTAKESEGFLSQQKKYYFLQVKKSGRLHMDGWMDGWIDR